MNSNIDRLSEKRLQDLIKELNLIIYDEENWINKDLWKIAEVTYSYEKETNINTTLFVKSGMLDLELYKKSSEGEKRKLLLKSKTKLENNLLEKVNQIDSALQEIELFDAFSLDKIDSELKSIFINSLLEKKMFMEYALIAIPFELEKAWIEIWFTENEKSELSEKLQWIDCELFGWKIIDNPEEVVISYEYIYDKYLRNIDKLSDQEINKFEYFLEKARHYLPIWYEYKSKEKPKLIEWKFLDYDLSKDDYILGFNILVEALEKLEHIVESNANVWSISDGPKWVQFPTSDKFKHIKFLRFFKLGNHEIETHNITDYNSRQLLWNMRWAKSTEKDEWVAMLMEQLFMYGSELYKIDEESGEQIIDINKIEISGNFIKTLMWELLENEELKEFLELSEIIDPDIISVNDRFLRLKRNNKYWVQHKDTTYIRWLLKAVLEVNKYIISDWKEWIAPEDLFLGKISFEETDSLKMIKQEKEKSGEKLNLLKPLFISDAVYYIISERLKNIDWEKVKINSLWFYKYLQEKYPIFNFTKEQIEHISRHTKENVSGLVNLLLKSISEQQFLKIPQNKVNNSILEILENQYNPKIERVRKKLHPDRKNAK